ncbi:hypothetical protein DFH09DRAFT_1085553 [Mycena vulgaris]|nr:hypothetical protein DFH09DRAFT_1085553 [Mycena vulgaris]
MKDTASEKPKRGWGGSRDNAGRPTNASKAAKLAGTATPDDNLVSAPAVRRARDGNPQPSSSNLPPAAFFQPYTTHHPVPRGNSNTVPAQTSRSLFWSALGASHPGATADKDTTSLGRDMADSLPPYRVQSASQQHVSPEEFAWLTEQLDYIEEHDEHADTAAGDRLINESLVDDMADSTEPNAAAEEDQSSEPPNKSVLHKQLVALQARLLKEEADHGRPLCYIRGDFFDRPSHPVFALEKIKDTTGLNPHPLYLRKVTSSNPCCATADRTASHWASKVSQIDYFSSLNFMLASSHQGHSIVILK